MKTFFCTCGHAQNEHFDSHECVRCPCGQFSDATTEYTQHLADIGDFALIAARRAMGASGGLTPFFVFQYPDGHLDIVVMPPPLTEIMCASSRAKEMIFDAMRETIVRLKIKLAVFITDSWVGRPSMRGATLSADQFIEAVKHDLQQAAADGIVERVPAITAAVQTPERMLIMVQFYEAGAAEAGADAQRIVWGEEMRIEAAMSDYDGTTKLFGKQEVSQ